MDLSIVEAAVKQIEEAKAAHKKALQEAIEPGLKYIAEKYGQQFQSIHIVGYTPSFNDGEPCEHYSDYGFGYDWLVNYGMEYLAEDWFEYEIEEDENFLENLMNPFSEVNVSEEVREFTAKVLDPYYEDKLVTNYQVHIRFFEDGTYKVEEDDYDCGY